MRFYSGWRLEGRQLSELQKLFSRYLDDKVINKMLDEPEKLQHEYIKRDATILMTDMVAFTTLSEGLLPEEIFSVVNDYHEVTVNQVFRNQGMLDKYIGDSVMAIFGAPLKDDQSKINAAKALVGIHEAVDELSAKRSAAGKFTIDIRAGIHTDEVVVGNIGHPRRVDYTAIGSGVNTASRLEGATRILGCRNLVSESFCSDLPDTIYRRELGTLILKGQSEALTVFELITGADYGAWIDDWAEAWRLWRDGKRQEAFQAWEGIQSARQDDAALKVMLKWLKNFVSSNGENDHVWTLTTK